MATGPLPVSDVVQVSVSAAANPVAARNFNQGLIVGSSTVIPSYGANARLRQYTSTNAMLTDGFINSDPEFISAELYFSNGGLFVWIGRQDLTAIQTIVPQSGNAGTGYVVGDILTVVQGGASNGKVTVLTVSGGGVPTSYDTTIGNQGTGYAIAASLSTTGGTGTGAEVQITAIGETCLQAVEACALVNQNWYGVMCCGAADADHLALAAYSTANYLTLLYVGSSSDASIPAGTIGNVALEMQAANYIAMLSYNTTQGGAAPNNIYAAAAILGVYCGLDTGLPGSAFTLNLKTLAGIAPEPLTQTQYTTILAANCNSCVSYGPYIGQLVTGILSNGTYFDQILYRATLVNLMQTNIMNLLTTTNKIPQTDPGEHQLLAQCDQACSTMADVGYIGPGIWTGEPVLNLATGQALPLGYLNQAPPFATQSSANRALRQAMPIYSTILEAGAVQSVIIAISVEP